MAAIVANTGSNSWNTNAAWVGSVQPTAADEVTIPATAVVTIPTATTAVCRSCTVSASGTLAFASTTAVLTIGDATAGTGSVAFSNAGTITLTGIGTINYISTSATVQTVTTGGQTLPNETYNATSNGSWQFADNHTSSGKITLTKGTLDMNGKTVQCTVFDTNNSNTRTLTLGAASITCTFAGEFLTATAVTGLTFTANTATFISTGAGASTRTNWTTMNGASLTFQGGGAMVGNNGGTSPTVNNLTITGTAVKTDSFSVGANGTFTVSGTLNITGNSTTNRVLVASSAIGTSRTITAAAVSLANVDFKDITGAGAASPFTGTSIGGGATVSNTSSITATTPVTRYWVGGTGSWSSTAHWSTSSGGSTGASVPLIQDSAIVDASSGGGTITVDMPRISGLDMSAAAACTLGNSSVAHSIFGSYVIGTNVTLTTDSRIKTFEGRSSYSITSAGKSWTSANWVVDCATGTYTLTDALTFTGTTPDATLKLNSGTFNSGNQAISVRTFGAVTTTTKTLTLGTSTMTINSVTAQTVFDASGTATTVSASSSTIVIGTVATGVTRTFAGGGYTWGTLTYTIAGSTGSLIITGANSFQDINFSDATNARTLQFTSGTTTTIRATHGLIGIVGTSGKLMTVSAVTASSPATLAFTNGYGGGSDWLSVQDITATTNTWYAGANSTNVSGNTNVTFTAAPGGGTTYTSSLAGVLSFAGVFNRFPSRSLTATSTFSGNMTKSTYRNAAGGLSFSGTIKKTISKAVNGVLSFIGSTTRTISRNLGSTALSFTGAMQTAAMHFKAFTASLGFTGVFSTIAIHFKAFTAGLSFTGGFKKLTSRAHSASLSFSGLINRFTSKFLTDNPNLIYNGSFETGTGTTNANFNVPGWLVTIPAAATVVSIDTTPFYGSKSILIAVDAGNSNNGIKQNAGAMVVTPLTTYTLSFYVKSSSAGALQIQLGDGSGNFVQNDGVTWNTTSTTYQSITTSTTWTLFTFTFATAAGQTLAYITDFKRSGTGSQASKNFWVDGVAVNLGATAPVFGTSSFLSFSGLLGKQRSKLLTAALSFTGSFAKLPNKLLTAGLSFTGVFKKQTNKANNASLSFTGNAGRLVKRSFAVTLSFIGSIIHYVTTHYKVKSTTVSTGTKLDTVLGGKEFINVDSGGKLDNVTSGDKSDIIES